MVALLLAVLFQSTTPASNVTTLSAPPAKAAPKRVCRKETVVGSTIKKKICPRPVEEARDGDDADVAEKAEMAEMAQAK